MALNKNDHRSDGVKKPEKPTIQRGLSLWDLTRCVYDFFQSNTPSSQQWKDFSLSHDRKGQERIGLPNPTDMQGGALWSKAKGVVQHQYGLTPLAWACAMGQSHIEGHSIALEDLSWLWNRPHLAQAPLSRIVGYGWFCGRRFDLNGATLDPRWESEGLVDVVCAQWSETQKIHPESRRPLDNSHKDKGLPQSQRPEHAGPVHQPRILDVGTGSGCLLIELLIRYPMAVGWGIDISADAVAIATHNAETHGVDQRAHWIVGPCVELLSFGPSSTHSVFSHTFDMIVSNPPYVPKEYPLSQDVYGWDPAVALYGGMDGLECYRTWIKPMAQMLSPGGILVLEIGHDQGDAVWDLCQQAGLKQGGVHLDGDGKNRYVSGRWA